MKLLVGVPTFDRRLDIDLFRTLLMIERQNKHHLDYLFPCSSHLSRNRNYVCSEALKGSYEGVLFLDSDIGIQDEGFIDKMIECGYKFDARIVGGAYRMKKPNDETIYIAGKKLDNGKYENLRKNPKTPQLVNSVGTGIMLIFRNVLERVADPWFTIVDSPNLEVMPEDFEFCRKAEEAGFKIAIDPTFTTTHYGHFGWQHNP